MTAPTKKLKKIDAKKALLKKRKKIIIGEDTCLSTGSTMLNLAYSDHPRFGFIPGNYYFLVGDSTSGKTWLSMTCFAESRLHPNFEDYELHFDDVENGALMDIERFFGKKVAKDLVPHQSETIQDFYRNLYDLLVIKKKKIIYVLDSQDALDDIAAKLKFKQQKVAAESGQKEKGSYGMGKAKYHSENIRWVMSGLRKTGSILIIIGQTRDNVDMFSFEKKTRSGGKSLRFYAAVETWTELGKKITKPIRGKERSIGINVIATVKKNRITGKIGKERAAVIPIYHSFGIDDVGSMVDFMISEEGFKLLKKRDEKNRKRYRLPEGVDFAGTRGEIIKFVEDNDAVRVLQDMVAVVWKDIEEECKLVGRKRRYE